MIGDRQTRDSRCAAPEAGWRSTIMLGPIASMFRAVSTSVSPLTTLELAMATPSVSALSRFSAISNDVRVRVDGSKNRFTTVRPRSAGTFLICALRDLLHRLGGVEDEHDLLGGELGDAEQVLAAQRRGRQHRPRRVGASTVSPRFPRETSSLPSVSATRTWTFSRRDVGMFLPT